MGPKEGLMQTGNGRVKAVGLLTIGGLIGAGAALVLAPQSGKRTRRDILHVGKIARNKSERVLLDLGQRTSRMVDTLSERL
jgi:gas vesicle protein